MSLSDSIPVSMQEGSTHDRGLYARSFEELFDLSNSDATSTSRYSFSVSVFELYNEQVLSFSITVTDEMFKLFF